MNAKHKTCSQRKSGKVHTGPEFGQNESNIKTKEYRRMHSTLLPSRTNPENSAAEAPGMKLNGPKAPKFPDKDIKMPPMEAAANPTLKPRINPINGEITLDRVMNFPGAPKTGKTDHRDKKA
ncbi:MAG: hypothetical protein QXL67_04860 [Candidatus Bathyarchaeia archaeon]